MNANVGTSTKQLSVIDQFRRDLEKMGPQFSYALPAHIPVERFTRVVMTAIQNNAKLLACTRQSIFNACMKCAQDGLLPDGREAAIVPFGENEDGMKKSDQATYLPMIGGIRKKARNSGEIADLWAREVHEGDAFDYQEGDDPHILHKPALLGGSERKITHVYSICRFKDGELSRCVMTIAQVEEIRQKFSRAKKGGPWNDRVTYGEMAKKTVVRRHAKELPSSTDLDHILHRDDELYDMKGAAERGKEVTKRQPASAMAALEQFAAGRAAADDGEPQVEDFGDPRPGDDTVIDHDPQTGEVKEPDTKQAAGTKQAAKQADDKPTPQRAFLHLTGSAEKRPPKTADQFKTLARGVIEAAKDIGPAGADRLNSWWTSEVARKLRNGAGMTGDDTAEIFLEVKAACDELSAQ